MNQQDLAHVESDVLENDPNNRGFDSLSTFTQGRTNNQTGVGVANAVVNPVTEGFYSSLRTRSVVEPDFIYTEWPEVKGVDKSLKMSYSPLLKKPFHVKNITWTTTNASKSDLASISIPSELLLNNPIVECPFGLGSYFRAKVSLIFQVSGTPSHSGIVLVGALPYSTYGPDDVSPKVNRLMSAPHAFLHANESTSVRLQIPFYSNTALLPSFPQTKRLNILNVDGNYAVVRLVVMNQLVPGTSAINEVTISVHAVFDDVEFYVPNTREKTWVTPAFAAESKGLWQNGQRIVSDILDASTAVIKKGIGLHNPNNALQNPSKDIIAFRQSPNVVSATTNYEKMDPYTDFDRITRDYIFNTKQDEMDLKYLLSKPMFIGSFDVKATSAKGSLLFSRPITPMQIKGSKITAISPYNNTETTYYTLASTLQTIAWMSKYWRGSLNIHIQSSMSNFQFVKLQVVRDYAPDMRVLTSVPDPTKLQSMMVETIEFSGGGQVQTVKLPFASMFNKIPTTVDPITNALCHGMYYIYLAQPLVTSLSSATTASFNVYLSAGDDFQLFGYALDPLTMIGFTPQTVRERSSDAADFKAEASVLQPISSQNALTTPGHSTRDEMDSDHQPIRSVRDFIRRSYRTIHRDYTADDIQKADGLAVYDVYKLVSEWFTPSTASAIHREYASPRGILKAMFFGVQGGIKVKALIQGTSVASMWYIPPGMSIRNSDTSTESQYMGTTVLPGSAYPNALQCVRACLNLYNEDGVLPYNWSCVATSVERPNYINSSANQSINYGTTGKVVSAASCILEGHLPNLSPLNFVGDTDSLAGWKTTSDADTHKLSTDMGQLIISFGRPCFYRAGTANEASDVNLSLYIAMDDQTRYGYHVSVPEIAPPTVNEGSTSTTTHTLTVANQYDGFPYQPNYYASAYYN